MPNISDTLISCGVSRIHAKVVEALSDGQFHSLRDIEKLVDLRQPEVSLAAICLSEYLEASENPSGGKGRPEKCVRTSRENYREYISKLVAAKREKIAELEMGIKTLERLKSK